MTVLWGGVLMAVAFGARRLEDNVVNNALAIASFVSGILLGVFLLGILTRRVGQPAALVGVLAGISAVTYAKFGTTLAWPWFALVGSFTVFAVGLAASFVFTVVRTARTSRSAGSSLTYESDRRLARKGKVPMTLEDQLLTESHNPRSESIDTLSPLELVRLMNSEDKTGGGGGPGRGRFDRTGDRVGGGPAAARRAADLRRGGNIRASGCSRCRRVSAHVQHAARRWWSD